ncbi:hypothetical protein NL108_015138 [Boleophthalmus pectinirostris]|nr:hypothetical protein NL108_015138 [Boleophthalmus pectinirostris]
MAVKKKIECTTHSGTISGDVSRRIFAVANTGRLHSREEILRQGITILGNTDPVWSTGMRRSGADLQVTPLAVLRALYTINTQTSTRMPRGDGGNATTTFRQFDFGSFW